MISLGIDLGSSSVKVALVDHVSGRTVASAQYPPTEMPIDAPRPGWAEQDPDLWWHALHHALGILSERVDLQEVTAIGIAYQMHGLVCVDREGRVLRPAVIWCDSRAVATGERAFHELGSDFCLQHYLNSPGNFTAAKLRWLQEHEPELYGRIHKIMLPGDYLAMRLTGEITTTLSGLSEGILWDFQTDRPAEHLLDHWQIDPGLLPPHRGSFDSTGQVSAAAATELGLRTGTPLTYRAGDQPNNAFSLGVMRAGEVAATAGTSGVVYGVTDRVGYDPKSRVNTFAHVNHTAAQTRLGVLLCINGTGIANAWTRRLTQETDYEALNRLAAGVAPGAEGLRVLPFGNGAERMFENRSLDAQISGLDYLRHDRSHLYRATLEGIACSFRYGMDILKENGVQPSVIRAGRANLFLSPTFRETLATLTGSRIELYNTDGATGAARGAAVGMGQQPEAVFQKLRVVETVNPDAATRTRYEEIYAEWKGLVERAIGHHKA